MKQRKYSQNCRFFNDQKNLKNQIYSIIITLLLMFSPPASGVDMIIGSFRAVDEGYVGHIETLSFGRRAVVFVPLEDDPFSYDVLFVHADNDVTLKFGHARRHKEKAREYLKVRLDCPALPSPLEATMSLKASREGTYLLDWERKDTKPKKQS